MASGKLVRMHLTVRTYREQLDQAEKLEVLGNSAVITMAGLVLSATKS